MSSFTISPSEGPGIYAKALGAAIFGHVDQVYRELRRLEQERRYDEAYQRKKVLGAEITKICDDTLKALQTELDALRSTTGHGAVKAAEKNKSIKGI
jgi:hypothetical protein